MCCLHQKNRLIALIVHASGITGEDSRRMLKKPVQRCENDAGGLFQHPAMLGRAACRRPAAAPPTIGWTVAETGEADGDGGAFSRRAADGN